MARKSRTKLEFLKKLESKIQLKWEQDKTFEVDALPDGATQEKCFVTFPMPYINERLHLGHAFTLTKCEFYIRFQRLKGKVCLFPLAFHGTGSTVKSSIEILKNELDKNIKNQYARLRDKDRGDFSKNLPSKEKELRSLLNLMQSFGLNDSQVLEFREEEHCVDYFSAIVKDLKRMGLHIDWRRCFVSSDKNKLFDHFVKWQFRRLKNVDKIQCSDKDLNLSMTKKESSITTTNIHHEEISTEEQGMIVVKFVIKKGCPERLSFLLNNGKTFLIVAIERPESLGGLTNFWVNPDMDYVAFPANDYDYHICSLQAAKTLHFKDRYVSLETFIFIKGHELVGTMVDSPQSHYTSVYVLPSNHIKCDSGTGILPSFPSERPDDYIYLQDLKEDLNFSNSYKTLSCVIKHFTPVPVIDVPVLGIFSAIVACNIYDVQGLNDTDGLEKAIKLIDSLKNNAVMMSGELKGMNLNDAKKIISLQLFASNDAICYYKRKVKTAPEYKSWYIDYSNKEWKQKTKLAFEKVETNDLRVKRNIEVRLQKLAEHYCTTTSGSGTRLPWDSKFFIEPLSDSTMFMAFLTISHLLDIAVTYKMRFEFDPSLIDELFDYIFLGKKNNCILPIDPELLEKMKREFEYWYPVDLICAEKKLIKNHVLFLLYHHTAIWPETYLGPKSIKFHGTLDVNSLKISKEKYNVLTISEAIEKYGADATRFALADATNTLEIYDFNNSIAELAIMKLQNFIDWAERTIKEKRYMRNGPPSEYTFHDEVFFNEMCLKLNETNEHYSTLSFKKALRTGFFNFQSILRKYRKFTGDEGFHWDLIRIFIRLQAIAISPICPHLAEYVYSSILNEPGTVVDATWPTGLSVNLTIIDQSKYLLETIRSFQKKLKLFVSKQNKSKKKPVKVKRAHIWVSKSYNAKQQIVIEYLMNERNVNNIFPSNRKISEHLRQNIDLRPYNKQMMTFVQSVKDRILKEGFRSLERPKYMDEFNILEHNKFHLKCALEVEEVMIHTMTESIIPIIVEKKVSPLKPQILFELKVEIDLTLINCQPFGRFTIKHIVCTRDMTYYDLRSLIGDEHYDVDFWRCQIDKEETHVCLKEDCTNMKVHIPRNAVYILDHLNEKMLVNTGVEVFPLGETIYYVINDFCS